MMNKFTPGRWDKVDPRAAAAVIFMSIVEFEIFMQPKKLVVFAQQDAWLSILIGSLIASAGTWLLVSLAARFPQENLFAYNRKVWGRPGSFLIALGYILFWIVYLVVLFKDTDTANKMLFLPKTPSLVPMLIFAVSAAWLVSYGISALVRFFQLMLPLMILPVLPIYIMAFRWVDWSNFLPVLSNGWLPVLKGAIYYAGILQGLEIILFLSPFLRNVKKALVPSLIGINLVNFTVLMHGVIAIGLMGPDNIKVSIWPGVDTIQLLELPGFPVERFELLFTVPWITAVFTSICLMAYLVSYGIIQLFHFPWRKGTIFFVSISAVLGTYLIPNYIWTLKIREIFYLPTLLFVYFLPLLTFIGAAWRGKRGNS